MWPAKKRYNQKEKGPRKATEPTEGLYETQNQTALVSLENQQVQWEWAAERVHDRKLFVSAPEMVERAIGALAFGAGRQDFWSGDIPKPEMRYRFICDIKLVTVFSVQFTAPSNHTRWESLPNTPGVPGVSWPRPVTSCPA